MSSVEADTSTPIQDEDLTSTSKESLAVGLSSKLREQSFGPIVSSEDGLMPKPPKPTLGSMPTEILEQIFAAALPSTIWICPHDAGSYANKPGHRQRIVWTPEWPIELTLTSKRTMAVLGPILYRRIDVILYNAVNDERLDHSLGSAQNLDYPHTPTRFHRGSDSGEIYRQEATMYLQTLQSLGFTRDEEAFCSISEEWRLIPYIQRFDCFPPLARRLSKRLDRPFCWIHGSQSPARRPVRTNGFSQRCLGDYARRLASALAPARLASPRRTVPSFIDRWPCRSYLLQPIPAGEVP